MKKLLTLFLLFLSFCLTACKDQALIPKLPEPVVIAVAPYNQPTLDAQLLAGYIPDGQNLADAASLARYDGLLKEKLSKTQRKYLYLTQKDLQISIQKDSKNRPNVLATWAKVARDNGADFILIPQIIEHQEKIGKDRDVFSPARLISDFYLVKAAHPETDSTDGFLQARSHYREISTIDINVSGEDYITPRQHNNIEYFVKESIQKMIREFHLTLE